MSFKAYILQKYPGILKRMDRDKAVLRRLRKAVDYAYKSKFYRERLSKAGVKGSDLRSLADFKKKVPLTNKHDLLSASPYDYLAIQPGEQCLIYAQTSGTTGGGHVPLWASKSEIERSIELAMILPVFQKYLSPKEIVALCYPYTRTMAGRYADLMNQRAGVTIIPMGTRNNLYPPEEVVDALKRLKPTILGAVATDAYAYANILMDEGIDPKSIGIKLIVSGAEPCADSRGEVLGEIFGAKFLSLLGQNEIGGSIPCQENVLHIPSFGMFTELYHDDGTEAELGEPANSVVTPTWREAMPILRYETGDVIIMEREPCACGLPLPTMKILGRKQTRVKIKNKIRYPIQLEDLLYKAPLNGVWYQIKITDKGLYITAEHRNKKEYPELKEQIISNFKKSLGADVKVRLKPPGTLYDYRKVRPGKALSRIVDDVSGKTEVIEGS
jgi:phenylacetate-CoA ligase